MNYEDWPDCIVPGCPNKCCRRLHSPRCYPHTLGLDQRSTRALHEMSDEADALLAERDREGRGKD